MPSRIVGGRIHLPLNERQVAVFIALYWGDETANCNYCKQPEASVMHCWIEYGARPSDNVFVQLQTPEETKAALNLVAEAFLDGKGLCANCYNLWQDESHRNLREKLGGDWDRETVTYERGNRGCVYSPGGAMAEVQQPLHDAAIPDSAIVLTVHQIGNEHYGNVWLKNDEDYTRLLPERQIGKVEGATAPFDPKAVLMGERIRFLKANQDEYSELPFRLLIEGLGMQIDRL